MGLVVAFLHLEDLAYIATMVLAVATVALLLAALWAGKIAQDQLAEQRRIEMRRRAYDHLEVFGSHEHWAALYQEHSSLAISEAPG